MNTSTTRRRRFSIVAAAIATTAAVAFGAAACGTETGSDVSDPVAPAAPAPAPTVKNVPYHAPISADAAERQYAAQERPETVTPPGRGYRPIPIP